ncbi:MATE family efflux transporter [Roseovarius sp. EL26]|uniref:MATE family efflux transporter n=1 Tax=Roseovarius sp. EL26 TaxID=2126672 RepID=UPI000EA3167C|nr:MATE family efflux transporter [Roseovarius sp. EL26]
MIFQATELMGIYRRAVPLGLANMSLAGLVFTDTMMLGQHDLTAMAAASVMMQMYLILLVLGEGIVFGFGPIYGRYHSNPDSDRHIDVVATAVRLLAIYALMGALILMQTGWIVSEVVGPSNTARDAQTYVMLLGVALLPNLLFIICWELLAFEQHERLVLGGALVQFVTNALVNYVLIFGAFGIPGYGLIGAGIATLMSSTVGLVVMAIACRRTVHGVPSIRAVLVRKVAGGISYALEILRIGLPVGLMIMATIGFLSLSLLLMARFGTQAVAAHSAVMQVSEVLVVFALGFGDFAAIHFASLRAVNRQRAQIELVKILRAALVLFVPVITGLFVVRSLIARVFFDADDVLFAEVQTQVQVLAAVSLPSLIFSLVLMVLQGSLRGRGITTRPAIIVLFCYWGIAVPLQFILLRAEGAGPLVIWIGLVSGFVLATIALAACWCLFFPQKDPMVTTECSH